MNSTPRRCMKQADSDTHAVLLVQFLRVIKGPGQEKETSHPWPHRVQQKPREYIKLIKTFVAFCTRKAGSILACQAVDD